MFSDFKLIAEVAVGAFKALVGQQRTEWKQLGGCSRALLKHCDRWAQNSRAKQCPSKNLLLCRSMQMNSSFVGKTCRCLGGERKSRVGGVSCKTQSLLHRGPMRRTSDLSRCPVPFTAERKNLFAEPTQTPRCRHHRSKKSMKRQQPLKRLQIFSKAAAPEWCSDCTVASD